MNAESRKKTIKLPFTDRFQAGRLLGKEMHAYARRSDVIVLALPRGGVPVGFEVANEINAPLDLMLVRKLGVPGRSELAMGAIAIGGVRVLNQEVINSYGISRETIESVVAEEQAELDRRNRAYRDDLPLPDFKTHCVILVDDGLATGATMRAAVAALRKLEALKIVVAIPIGAAETIALLRDDADEVICLAVPDMLFSIGQWYEDFTQVSDEEVCRLLASASQSSFGKMRASE